MNCPLSKGFELRPASDWTELRIWLSDKAVKLVPLEAASSTRTLESMLFAPSAVARTSAERLSPSWYDISFATFSTVLSIEVAKDRLEKFA